MIVPAFNEEQYLGATLQSVADAAAAMPATWRCETIVVDDLSHDSTAEVARSRGARVVTGRHDGIGAARNVGASQSQADLFVFIDADTLIPASAFTILIELYEASGVRALSIPSEYFTTRMLLKPLLAWWRRYAPARHVTQGVFQAYDRGLFEDLQGYDERLLMAEDTDLFDRAIARLQPTEWRISDTVRVKASMRRYEKSPIVVLWLLTNPLTTRYFRRTTRLWSRWYTDPPR